MATIMATIQKRLQDADASALNPWSRAYSHAISKRRAIAANRVLFIVLHYRVQRINLCRPAMGATLKRLAQPYRRL